MNNPIQHATFGNCETQPLSYPILEEQKAYAVSSGDIEGARAIDREIAQGISSVVHEIEEKAFNYDANNELRFRGDIAANLIRDAFRRYLPELHHKQALSIIKGNLITEELVELLEWSLLDIEKTINSHNCFPKYKANYSRARTLISTLKENL